ncbi:MAG: hypothetical protein ACTSXV_02085 [Alphaproteobacteria bacterium]
MKKLILILLVAFVVSLLFSNTTDARLSSAGKKALKSAEKLVKSKKADVDKIIAALKLLCYYPDVKVAEWLVEKGLPKLAENPDLHLAYYQAKKTLILIMRDDGSGKTKEYLDDQMFNEKLPSSLRSEIIETKIKESATKDFLVKVLEDPAPDVKLRALNHISTRTLLEEEYYPIILKLLKNEYVKVKREALIIIKKYLIDAKKRSDRELEIIEAFIERVKNDESVIKGDCIKALKAFSGQDLGDVAEIWTSWFLKYKKGETANDLKKEKHGTTAVYHGISTYSKRIVYIIDTSVSMEEDIDPETLEEIKKKISVETAGSSGKNGKPGHGLNWDKIRTKFDLAKAELIRSIGALPKPGENVKKVDKKNRRKTRTKPGKGEIAEADIAFTIIAYSSDVSKWKEVLVPADEKNKKDAIKWINKLDTGRKTNIYDALSAGFDIAEGKVSDGKKSAGTGNEQSSKILVDTIFFLTDGFATTGKYYGGLSEILEIYDTDLNSKISRVEFRNMFCDWFSDDEVKDLFDRIDGNADGNLSIASDPKADCEFNNRWRTRFYFDYQMPRMVKELVKRNEMLKIQVHTIAIGKCDYTTLKSLAKQTDGEYVALGGAHK